LQWPSKQSWTMCTLCCTCADGMTFFIVVFCNSIELKRPRWTAASSLSCSRKAYVLIWTQWISAVPVGLTNLMAPSNSPKNSWKGLKRLKQNSKIVNYHLW
jgi:hypothetical protein